MSGAETQASEQRRYRLNEPAIAADIFDGEAVIMHLETGTYYGLDKVGADVWTLILSGRTVDDVARAIADRYRVERDAVASDVGALVTQMVGENLIVEASDEADELSEVRFHAETYAPPSMSIYRDMKDLLALDPPLPDFKAKDFR